MEQINYKAIENKFSWLFIENQKTIISPDIDGILCGLFMSNFLNWKIVGFYDGKYLCHSKSSRINDAIFLDIEIFRKDMKSCGHHMLMYNINDLPQNWENFSDSINPNNLRGFDVIHQFKRKYPLATIHFLLCCISEVRQVEIKIYNTTTVPLLYVDGTFKNLLNYPENCSDWLTYLNAKNPNSPVYPIFEMVAKQRLKNIIHLLQDIFDKFDDIRGRTNRGDKISIRDIRERGFRSYHPLLCLLSNYTGWEFNHNNWILNNLEIIQFRKKIEMALRGNKFLGIVRQNPLSWAITSRKRMEYTLES